MFPAWPVVGKSRDVPSRQGGDIDSFVGLAIEDGLFPGCALAVSIAGRGLVLERAWGRLTNDPASPPCTTGTIYDLASLTKPLAVALSFAVLVSRGILTLETTAGEILGRHPAASSPVLGASIRRLLCHTAGFVPWRPYHERLAGIPGPEKREALLGFLLSEAPGSGPSTSDQTAKSHKLGMPLRRPGMQGPQILRTEAHSLCAAAGTKDAVKRGRSGLLSGIRAVYSDLGYMLLGILLEEVTGLPLDRAVHSLVLSPLGAEGLRYGCDPHMSPDLVSPAGFCPYRNRDIRGQVHDLNAWAMDGVAGHAGLFGSILDVVPLLERILAMWRGEGTAPGIDRKVVAEFLRPQGIAPGMTWALGFDTPSPVGSTAGKHFSPKSVGHLGYTGTSFWMDPEDGVIVVFLSNRTACGDGEGSRRAMKVFRAGLHDLVREAFG